MRNIRLTPPQVELLTDIATKPQMFIRNWSRWAKTASVLIREELAVGTPASPSHMELRITEKGQAEASRRGIVGQVAPGPQPTSPGGAS